MDIILSYPSWFMLFCLLAGGLYSFVLYSRDKKFNETPVWLRWFMMSARFITISILAFLLLSPLIKTISREIEKPVVIVAQDNSTSIIMVKDSAFYKNQYRASLVELTKKLSDKYEVRSFSFGDKISESFPFDFTEKQTDISSFLDEMETRFSNRNIGAVILASDGLYNKGRSPSFAATWLKSPVYTIALGDTTEKKDVRINNIVHNRIAFLKNTFPVDVVIDAKRLQGKSTELSVSKKGKVLFNQKINIHSDPFTLSVPCQFEADESGLQRYRVVLKNVEGEENTINNTTDFFIDVIDSRQKILILANAPHPDVAALKQSIEGNQNYEVESQLASNFNKPIKQYSLVILHNLPSLENQIKNHIEYIRSASIPVWVLGSRVEGLPLGVTIRGNASRTNESEPVFSKEFPLFTVSQELARYFSQMPAVQTPFGNYAVENSANALLMQRIGVVETQSPMMVFNQDDDWKLCYFVGEGIWRWKLRDYAEHDNTDLFSELVSKTVQFLSLKKDKSFFKIILNKSIFFENEAVEFEGEVYNESYELINEQEVNINIYNSDNKKYAFTFTKTSNAYRLNAGVLGVGEYRYEANIKLNGKSYSQNGTFSVSPLMIEAVNTVANHQSLFQLSKKTGGEMLYPSQMDELMKMLESREDIKPVSHSEKKLSEIINLPWIFYTLLILLTLEWLIRKRSGAY